MTMALLSRREIESTEAYKTTSTLYIRGNFKLCFIGHPFQCLWVASPSVKGYTDIAIADFDRICQPSSAVRTERGAVCTYVRRAHT